MDRHTGSICPICKKRIPAEYKTVGDNVVFEKICDIHGSFSTVVWRGKPGFDEWTSNICCEPDFGSNPSCPSSCGLCEKHCNDTCCTILDITDRCNLNCPYCFANGDCGHDKSFDYVMNAIDDIYAKGRRYIYFSGGEPTVHPDLPKFIRHASEIGFDYIQLNTNGLRIAFDSEYMKELAGAGLSNVFLQFDGTNDEIFRSLRGKDLLEIKKKAIENCGQCEIGVVLVPMIVPGVNDTNIGAIIRFAYEHMPAVKGVHFQPVAYTGKYSDGEHFTMPELMSALEEQTEGLIPVSAIKPSACDSALCGFHAEFKKSTCCCEYGTLVPVSSNVTCNCGAPDVSKNQNHVKARWTRVKDEGFEEGSLDALHKDLNDNSFCVSAMLFQDLSNIDIKRLMQCSLHVYDNGKFVPFCAYNNYYDRHK